MSIAYALLIMLGLIFFLAPAQATITTSLDAVCDDSGQTRIIENSQRGSIDVSTIGAMAYSGTKTISKDSTEGMAQLDADAGKIRLRTPEYANLVSGEYINASVIYGFAIKPVEVEVTDTQDNSTTILTTTTMMANSAIVFDVSALRNAMVTERINVPYKGRPLTIAEVDQIGGALLFNRTLELSGKDIWEGEKL